MACPPRSITSCQSITTHCHKKKAIDGVLTSPTDRDFRDYVEGYLVAYLFVKSLLLNSRRVLLAQGVTRKLP